MTKAVPDQVTYLTGLEEFWPVRHNRQIAPGEISSRTELRVRIGETDLSAGKLYLLGKDHPGISRADRIEAAAAAVGLDPEDYAGKMKPRHLHVLSSPSGNPTYLATLPGDREKSGLDILTSCDPVRTDADKVLPSISEIEEHAAAVVREVKENSPGSMPPYTVFHRCTYDSPTGREKFLRWVEDCFRRVQLESGEPVVVVRGTNVQSLLEEKARWFDRYGSPLRSYATFAVTIHYDDYGQPDSTVFIIPLPFGFLPVSGSITLGRSSDWYSPRGVNDPDDEELLAEWTAEAQAEARKRICKGGTWALVEAPRYQYGQYGLLDDTTPAGRSVRAAANALGHGNPGSPAFYAKLSFPFPFVSGTIGKVEGFPHEQDAILFECTSSWIEDEMTSDLPPDHMALLTDYYRDRLPYHKRTVHATLAYVAVRVKGWRVKRLVEAGGEKLGPQNQQLADELGAIDTHFAAQLGVPTSAVTAYEELALIQELRRAGGDDSDITLTDTDGVEITFLQAYKRAQNKQRSLIYGSVAHGATGLKTFDHVVVLRTEDGVYSFWLPSGTALSAGVWSWATLERELSSDEAAMARATGAIFHSGDDSVSMDEAFQQLLAFPTSDAFDEVVSGVDPNLSLDDTMLTECGTACSYISADAVTRVHVMQCVGDREHLAAMLLVAPKGLLGQFPWKPVDRQLTWEEIAHTGNPPSAFGYDDGGVS